MGTNYPNHSSLSSTQQQAPYLREVNSDLNQSESSCEDSSEEPIVKDASSQLIQDLFALVNHQPSADFLFVVGKEGREFYAHRAILWSRCQHFKKMFDHDLDPSHMTSRSVMTLTFKHYDPVVFEALLQYIYTGQICIRDSSVFSLIIMAKDLGLPGLLSLAEEYVMESLNVNNACGFFTASLHLEKLNRSPVPRPSPDLASLCQRYIEDHAADCVMTDGWRGMSKAAVIALIRSQKFSLEEDAVWRAIVAWAKYHGGVAHDRRPKDWTNSDKQRIAQALGGVMDHIKLFLISNQLFADEVEPSGLVPVETILERYRYAVVAPSSAQHRGDSRLCSRVSCRYFEDSAILGGELQGHQATLNKWFGSDRQRWTLLYRASRDGYSAESFHRLSDGHAPNMTIVKSVSGSVCGGFSDVPWTNKTPPRGRYLPSHRAFLFTLVNRQDVPPTKFDVTNSVLATLHHPGLGPAFGGGSDLCISDHCNTSMDSYSNFPHSFSNSSAESRTSTNSRDVSDSAVMSSVLMGDYHFTVDDYEVFTIAKT